MLLLNTLARQLMQSAIIVAVQRIAAHTYRLSLKGPALADWSYVPGQTLNVFFSLNDRADEANLRKRTYSVWGYDAVAGQLELVGRLHVFQWTGGPVGH